MFDSADMREVYKRLAEKHTEQTIIKQVAAAMIEGLKAWKIAT